ncbi:DEAD/DEAH box helicase [Mucilaginibacter litoreus]|uniref:DEAD/DEAH box helicase n=1 Tax=Mucilaginibacter litoreus TaxID=1048221 RepID=A0ABW3AR64_9SPHI
MLFTDLKLIEPILKALQTEGYISPTPIQQQAIPYILQHRDLLGCAQTGTGKTAAFAIPTLQLLHADRQQHREQKTIKALVLTPTRELAIQISDSFTAYGKNTGLKNLVIFGGVSQNPQVNALKRGIDILVATPGRLLDLVSQGYIHLNHIKILVLDEADRMLDMGFVNDVKKIIAKVPAKRQTLFFSATMPKEIQALADSILNNPARVEVAPVSSTADTIQQAVYFVGKGDKKNLLIHILKDKDIKTLLVFTRTKHGADKVVKDLHKAGITAEAIHGNKSQNARQRALTNFKNRTTRVLIATDIAARGIDIDELTHVVNYELPNIPETYVHRIGRTGRAGASGIALSFCDGEDEIEYLKDINKLIGKQVPIEEGHPYPLSIQLMNAKMTGKAVSVAIKGNAPAGQQRNSTNGNRNNRRNKRPATGGRPSNHRSAAGKGEGNMSGRRG